MSSGNKGEKYVVSLRRHIFRTPNWILSFTISSILIFLLSFAIHPIHLDVIYLFLLPYILAVLLDHITIKAIRIYFPLRRITSLNLFAFMISFIQVWILNYFYSFPFSFFFGFSSLIFIRYVIYRAFLSERKFISSVVSSYYSLMVFIVSIYKFSNFLLPYVLSSIVYGLMAFIFIGSTTRVFRREFREDPLFFLASFINYASRNKEEDVKKINSFFHSIYGNRKVPVTTIIFKNKEKVKGVFVVPYVHPGPFGEVGGSDLPNKLERYTGVQNLMVFHSTSTHDNNIASEEDVKKIAHAVKNAINKGCKYNRLSDLYRFEINGIQYLAQVFGKYAFIAIIPHRANFDDVELKTGMEIRNKILTYLDDAVVVDAHNNFDPHALPLSLTLGDISHVAMKVRNLKPDRKLRMGFGTTNYSGKSVGNGGVRVAVFEYGSKKIAYVLLDGNNVKRGLRKRLRNELMKYVDDVEIFSTDNHAVNMGLMDYNPVGERDDWKEIINSTIKALHQAIEDIEDVCVDAKTEYVEVRMAFSGELQRLAEITKKSLGRAKITAPATFIAGFVISYIIYYFL